MKKALPIKSFLFILPAFFVVAIVAVWNQNTTADDSAFAWPAVKVATAVAEPRELTRYFSGVGELEAVRQVNISAETAGQINVIQFSSGARAEAGQLLVQLNDAVEQADLLRLQAHARNAESLYQRTKSLHQNQVATQEQLEQTAAERDMAVAAVAQTRALINRKNIRAPFQGVVGIRRVHEGQYLNPGEAIVSLVDDSALNVNFSLDERSIVGLAAGMSVELRIDAWPDEIFPAVITAIDPLIDRSRMVQVQAQVDNRKGQLRAGMFAHINVVREAASKPLMIPETAVTFTAYGETVFVVDEASDASVVKRVAVETGERAKGFVEIKNGLSAGSRVVTSGQLRLSDGMEVDPSITDSLAAAMSAADQL